MANTNPKLISRTTIEEKFATDEDIAHGRDSVDLDDADEDEVDDEDQKPRKR